MLLNKTFEYRDMEAVERSHVPARMRHLVDTMTDGNLMTTSHASFRKSNLTDTSGWYRHTIYYGRMWEYARLIHFLDFEPGDRVLDCGGASSPIVFYLAAMGCQIDCIDLSEEMVRNTREVADKVSWSVRAGVGDMTDLPFESNVFDCVTSVSVIEHLRQENKIRAIQEMARVIKPVGRMGLTFDFGTRSARLSPDDSGEVHAPLESLGAIQSLIETSDCETYGNPFWAPDPLQYPAYSRPRLSRLLGRLFGRRLNTIIPRNPRFRAYLCESIDRTLGMLFLRKPA